jgi:hypothetical protein
MPHSADSNGPDPGFVASIRKPETMAKSGAADTPEHNVEVQRSSEAATRREHGIVPLAEGEQLCDDASFACMEESLALAHPDAAGGPPAGARPSHAEELEEELLLEEIATELPVAAGAQDARGPSPVQTPQLMSPSEVVFLEAQLLTATDRNDVARLALTLACNYARVAGLFVVNRGLVAGLRGRGDDLEQRIEGIVAPVDAAKLFSHPVSTGKPYRGGAAEQDMDNRLLRAMGRIDAQERTVLPIEIRGRAVNLLYADNGPDALAETSFAALRALCVCVAGAYERLILERKQPTERS